MKPVLLLAPPRAGARSGRRELDLRRVAWLDALDVADDSADYGSVIVVNDGGAETIRRLRLALTLRQRCERRLPVAVLTYLEPLPAGAGHDILERAAGAPRTALAALGPQLSVELRDAVLSLEYQAE